MGLHFIHLFENDFYALFPELFLTCTTMLLLMFGVVWSTSKAQGYPILTHTVAWLCVWSLVCAFGLTIHSPFSVMVSFYNTFVIDELTFLLKAMVICSATAAMLMSMEYLKTSMLNIFEYSILILLSTISMLLLISSYDFISMYLAIEMQSLCFYVLAASKRHSEFLQKLG